MVQLYMDEIKAMINHKRRRLIVNISDLHAFGDFGPRYIIQLRCLVPAKKRNTVEWVFDLQFLKIREDPPLIT